MFFLILHVLDSSASIYTQNTRAQDFFLCVIFLLRTYLKIGTSNIIY